MRFFQNSLLLLIAITINLFTIVSAYALPSYQKIIFFGDSLSDNGNLYQFLEKLSIYFPKSPPYYKGQFSNQEVWSEIVARHYREKRGIQSENYAVGGETISLRGGGFLPWTFYESIDNYILHTSAKERPNTLYIIWLGANDYLDGTKNDLSTYTENTLKVFNSDVERLISRGGKYFLFINLPDLSKTPYSHLKEKEDMVAKLSSLHNIKLEAIAKNLKQKYKNIQITVYHINELFDEFMNAPDIDVVNKKYNMHIHELKKFCWEGGYTLRNNNQDNLTDKNNLQYLLQNNPSLYAAYITTKKAELGVLPCKNTDDYLFWDQVHPTGVVHQLIAKKLIEQIDQNFRL